jgi:hypothetical protein
MDDIFYTEPKTGFTYGLFDSKIPTDIHYIGKTIYEPIVRLRSHLAKSNKYNKELKDWITTIQLSGNRLGMRILGEHSIEELLREERLLIRSYVKNIFLFNKDHNN